MDQHTVYYVGHANIQTSKAYKTEQIKFFKNGNFTNC